MNRCDLQAQLTAYLLGELPERERAALDAHLAACAECRATKENLSATLALLRDAFSAAGADGHGPVLDAARREALLAVRPVAPAALRTSWFTRRHPVLARAAAWVLILGGLFAVLSASLFPAVSNSPQAARRALERNALKAPSSQSAMDESRSEALSLDASGAGIEHRTEERSAPREIVAGKKVRKDAEAPVSWLEPAQPSSGKPATTATAQSDYRYRAKLDESEIDTKSLTDARSVSSPSAPAPAASAGLAAFTPAPAAFDSVSMVKSPIKLKGIYASRAPGASGATHGVGGAAHAMGEKLAAAAPEPDVTEEIVGRELTIDAKASVAQPEGKTRLKIAVPKPQFTGTPKDVRSPNLEAPGAREVGPFTDYFRWDVSKAKEESQTHNWFGAVVAGQSLYAAGGAGEGRPQEEGVVAKELQEIVSDRDAGAVTVIPADKTDMLLFLGSTAAAAAVPADGNGAKREAAKRITAALPVNSFVGVAAQPFSTFAMDVDTASYTLTRQALRAGALPDPERVRTEEIVNAFDYGDTAPERTVFRVAQDGAQSPFGAGYHLLRIGVKGRRLGREEQRPAMLTFVVDVSGSMSQPDRIGLARLALASLLGQLAASDRIQLIAYSDHARLVLEPVPASEKARVLAAFEQLQCNGSTNLEEGMRQAYEQAAKGFVPGAENRVILLSDGVANLGADSAQEILDQVAANRKQGITCSVFGVGAGTYNDSLLEGLANKGDGVYRFLDSEEAVRSAFVDDLAATLNTIAKDAKIQVEWNPVAVRRYRQLGYENRALTKEQFRDDAVDAGEVGSGQSVTALYELELAPELATGASLGTVRIRYQRMDSGKVEEIEAALVAETVLRPAHAAGAHFRVAASAAEFAELLRGSPHAAGGRFEAVADYLRPAALELSLDTRVNELLELVMAAAALKR